MVRVATIARVELLRLLRDRSNLFFILVLPLLLVVLIGVGFGGAMQVRVGVVAPEGDQAVDDLIAAIEAADGVVTVPVADRDALTTEVSQGRLSAGVAIPDGYGEALASADPVEVAFVGRPNTTALSLQQLVEGAVAEQAALAAAAAVAGEVVGVPPAEAFALARGVRGQLPGVEVSTEAVGGDELAREFAGLGTFDLGASTQLVLFTFLTALTGSASLIETRRLGVATRMVSTPTPVATLLAGQAAGRIAVALFQALYIVVATSLLFQVNWGGWLPTTMVVLLFCVVAGGAGMLVGSTARNDAQAAALGIGLGIGLAALGGSMVPLEIFPPAVRAVAQATPHAWANQALAEIIRRDGGIADVAVELAVLASFAAALLGLASWRLRRSLVG